MDNPYKSSKTVRKTNAEVPYPTWALVLSFTSIFLFEMYRIIQTDATFVMYTLPVIAILGGLPVYAAFIPALIVYFATAYPFKDAYHISLKYVAWLWSFVIIASLLINILGFEF